MKKKLVSIICIVSLIHILGCSSSSNDDNPTNNQPQLATIQTAIISNITTVSAISGGSISSDGNSPITEKGICWNTSPNPTITNSHTSDGTGTNSFVSNLTPLSENTTYYVRAYATNGVGTSYGNELSFTSNAIVAPTITTTVASNVKQITADSGGNITSDGGSAVISRGICWNTTGTPTLTDPKTLAGSGLGIFSAIAINLAPNTTYFLRAFATNSAGTSYGTQISFTTQNLSIPGGGVTDIDGNTYTTVILGGKEWMVENLRTTKYRNGDLLTNVTGSDWTSNDLHTGIWCYYNNNSSYNITYGKLYDWYAASDSRQIAPEGWHVPSIGEWDALIAYLGGADIAGGKLKDFASGNWISPNTGADNSSGFKAMPGGYRSGNNSSFSNQGLKGLWWTTDQGNSFYGKNRILSNNSTAVTENFSVSDYKSSGLSIRCVKD